jgi:hypothetical protein
MYPEDVTSSAAVAEAPQAFITIENCHKELSRMEARLSPIMSGASDKLSGGATPSFNELDGRLQSLLSHIREISKRVKL